MCEKKITYFSNTIYLISICANVNHAFLWSDFEFYGQCLITYLSVIIFVFPIYLFIYFKAENGIYSNDTSLSPL